MRKRFWRSFALFVVAVSLLAGCQKGAPPPVVLWSSLALGSHDRVLVLAPHPDDETIGCGGLIQQAVAMSLPLRVVFLTNGDNNEWSFFLYRKRPEVSPRAVEGMGEVRHDEALAAGKVLGLSAEQLTFLGYPDFGTLQIWQSHWGDRPAYRSLLTRATAVPYRNAYRPGAPYKGESILSDLTAIIRDFKPTIIFVSHPADHNPDHLALYLFTRVALWDLEPEIKPVLYPYLVHYPGWPQPGGYLPTDLQAPPAVLDRVVAWRFAPLLRSEEDRKLAALQAHRTQYGASRSYLVSFVRTNELFGDFPVVHVISTTQETALPAEGAAGERQASDQLTEQERAAFVGLEWRTVRLEKDALVVSLVFSRPLAQGVEASVDLFGYRSDRPFPLMPKLNVRLSELGESAFDQVRALPDSAVAVHRDSRQITVRVPLALLDQPQRVLISARTYLGRVPLDWISWRALEIAPAPVGQP